jgi:hypothetical protein
MSRSRRDSTWYSWKHPPRELRVHADLTGGLSTLMQTWGAGLLPGGYLLTALTPPGPDVGMAEHPVT